MQFGKTFWLIVIWMWLFPLVIIFLGGFSRVAILVTLILDVFSLLYAIGAALILALVMPVEVSKTTLHGRNAWGTKKEVPFSEISQVKYRWIVFPYVTISTPTQKNVLWVPLILKDMASFVRTVKDKTPPDNPLHLYFLSRGH